VPIQISIHSDCFARLRVLALNSCGVKSWAAVQLLSPHLPYVEGLYLAGDTLPDLPRLKAEQEYRDATGAEETALVEGKSIYARNRAEFRPFLCAYD